MTTTYWLVDYENIQPDDLDALDGSDCKVMVFLGPTQARIPTGLAIAMQALGANAEYVTVEAQGPNALDFHIAYYVGRLSAAEPASAFRIVSKDTGFDPLIRHLKAKGIACQRVTKLGLAATVTTQATKAVKAAKAALASGVLAFEEVVTDLTRRKAAKPRTVKTLRSTIGALRQGKLSAGQLDDIIKTLSDRGIVKIEGSKVTYPA